MLRQFRERAAGAGLHAEEIDEHALLGRGVLVDQNANRFARGQRLQNAARRVLLRDQVVTRQRAIALDQGVDARIIERPHHDVHGRDQIGVGEGAQLPIAQVRGGDQDALAALVRSGEIFQALITDPLRDGLARNFWKAREAHHQARNRVEDAGR